MFKKLSIVLLVMSMFYACDQYILTEVDTVAPGVVTGVTAEAGDGMVTLNWSNPIDLDLMSIEITYTGVSTPIVITDGSERLIVDELVNGSVYMFNLIAVDESGNRSEEVSISVTPVVDEDNISPDTVRDVTATPGDGVVLLEWSNPTDSDLFSIEITYTGESTPIIVTDKSESLSIYNLENGITYDFNFVSIDESGNRSEMVTISSTPVTPVSDDIAPDRVDNLIAEVGDGSVTLSWINPTDDDFFKLTIEYTGLEEPIEIINGDEFIMITDLTNGESYTFVVKTYDAVGNSSGSESVIAQPVATEPEFVNGINMVTWYAENYVPTGNEMTQDFTNVSWNEVYCDSVSDINSAFSNALPGDKIIIAPGTYSDTFKLSRGGTMDSPIWIVAEDITDWPILDGEDFNNGTVLGIDGGDSDIAYIYVQYIKVTNARLGIATDRADYVTIDNVEVYNIGQEAIHVRDGSEYNIIKNSYIHDTGLYNAKYGEGVYIGSDNGKWISNGGNYDPACDYTQVLNNVIGPNVTAEHIDIKEGSSYAYIMGNNFNAAGMKDILNGGLSFIDFKGNNAVCAYNTGDQNGNEYFENAFEVNDKWEGWGNYNYIHNNTVTFNEEFYNPNKVDVTVENLPLGSSGNPNLVTTTDDIDRDQWVVECNNQSSADGEPVGNVVYNNIRVEADADRMYNSFSRLSEVELSHEEIINLGL